MATIKTKRQPIANFLKFVHEHWLLAITIVFAAAMIVGFIILLPTIRDVVVELSRDPNTVVIDLPPPLLKEDSLVRSKTG